MMRQFNNTGIALIQVLLLTAILTVLVLYIATTSRQQVKLAIYADMRASALVELHNEKNSILFSLLTRGGNEFVTNNEVEQGTIEYRRNMYGKPYKVNQNITATIQDQSGLMSIHFINRQALRRLLISKGVSDIKADIIVQSLLDWQDIDNLTNDNGDEYQTLGEFVRNGYVPDITDLHHIPRLEIHELEILKKSFTTNYTGYFNPTLSPDFLLEGLLSESSSNIVASVRDASGDNLRQIPWSSELFQAEDVFFVPSNIIELKLDYRKGDVEFQKSWVIKVDPNAVSSAPINYIETRG